MNLSDESSFAVQFKSEKTVPSIVHTHALFARGDEQLSIVYDRLPPIAFFVGLTQLFDEICRESAAQISIQHLPELVRLSPT